uniref:Phosphatidate cytidylyltransferase n=1 Tax=candidate division WOR-3 bacterium TaxID=2052148 RepID=A0A7C4UC02_UNCW3
MRIKSRKLYRLLAGGVFPLIYFFTPSKIPVQMLIFYLLGILTPIEVIRKITPGFYNVLHEHSRGVLKKEPGILLGDTFYLIAVSIIIAIFSKPVAIISIAYLIIGDTFSNLIGEAYGKHRFKWGKSIEGSIAFFISSIISGFLINLYFHFPFVVILSGALIETLIEMLPNKIDDNFTIGIAGAVVMELFLKIY